MYNSTEGDSKKIIERIYSYGSDTPFVTSDFRDLSNRLNISKILSRLTERGVVERVQHGVYQLVDKKDQEQ